NWPMSWVAYVLPVAPPSSPTRRSADLQVPVGGLVVTLTVTDECGNASTCTANVFVLDNILPTITCPSNQTRNTDLDQCNYTAQGTEIDHMFAHDRPMAPIAYVLTGATT